MASCVGRPYSRAPPGPVYMGARGGEGRGLRCPSCWSQAFRATSSAPLCALSSAGPWPLVPRWWNGLAAWPTPPSVFSGQLGTCWHQRPREGTGCAASLPLGPHRLLPRRTAQPLCPTCPSPQVPWRGPFLCPAPVSRSPTLRFKTSPAVTWTSLKEKRRGGGAGGRDATSPQRKGLSRRWGPPPPKSLDQPLQMLPTSCRVCHPIKQTPRPVCIVFTGKTPPP